MIQFLTVIHVINCVLLIAVVLLQQGKKDGMGSAFGGGAQSVFGARGAETFLEKVTKVLAVLFMTTSLGLVYISSRQASSSILSGEGQEKSAPAAPSETAVPDATPVTPSLETAPAAEVPASEPAKP